MKLFRFGRHGIRLFEILTTFLGTVINTSAPRIVIGIAIQSLEEFRLEKADGFGILMKLLITTAAYMILLTSAFSQKS